MHYISALYTSNSSFFTFTKVIKWYLCVWNIQTFHAPQMQRLVCVYGVRDDWRANSWGCSVALPVVSLEHRYALREQGDSDSYGAGLWFKACGIMRVFLSRSMWGDGSRGCPVHHHMYRKGVRSRVKTWLPVVKAGAGCSCLLPAWSSWKWH